MADSSAHSDDPNLWLEDVLGEQALAWVRARNAITAHALEAQAQFATIRRRLLSAYDSEARIPFVTKHGNHFYNFWRDRLHVRGIWRRTTLDDYRKAEPAWETVLDVDALATAERENWVWNGERTCLPPNDDRCLIFLSRGGGDTRVVREFDLLSKRFLADGFNLPAAKSDVAWRDRDHLYVGTDFGPDSLTSSGYPRLSKLWRRGEPLSEARLVFAGRPTDVGVMGYTSIDRDGPAYVHRNFVWRGMTYYESEIYLHDAALTKLDLPADAKLSTFADQALVTLRFDWQLPTRRYLAGSLLVMPWKDFAAGHREFEVLFAPTLRTSLASSKTTRNFVIVNVLDNIRSRIYAHTREHGAWRRHELSTPPFGSVDVDPADSLETDDYFITATDFLTPTALSLDNARQPRREQLKQSPAFFDARGLTVTQHETTSKDGTRIPYFQVARANLELDGSNPTLLYGYGGFEVSSTPGYSAGIGIGWLEHGGVYVLANIRGGGEFGPTWHTAALKENRQRAFDDFIAIAEHLIARKVTSPAYLGIMGGSNGGLLVGAVMTQRPELFRAVVCQVPLLDMRRYHKLLAGASWMAEYGDPDVPEQWAYIGKYSPYQNLRENTRYPRVLFLTSTRDDRVHPGHARKMAAKMQTLGQEVLYYENIEGGHGGSANNEQAAYMNALAYTFLLKELRSR